MWYLPLYNPALNPIELAFAKLKTLLRRTQARTAEALWTIVGSLIGPVQPREAQELHLPLWLLPVRMNSL